MVGRMPGPRIGVKIRSFPGIPAELLAPNGNFPDDDPRGALSDNAVFQPSWLVNEPQHLSDIRSDASERQSLKRSRPGRSRAAHRNNVQNPQ